MEGNHSSGPRRDGAKPKSETPCNVQSYSSIVFVSSPKLSLVHLLIFACAPVASGLEGVDVVQADVGDQDSLETMCAKATVIINCVGPVSPVPTFYNWVCGHLIKIAMAFYV